MQVLFGFLLFGLLSFAAGAQSQLPECSSAFRQHCFGTATFTSGAKYVGEFKDDKLNGQGTLTFPDGQKYVGEFKDDKRNGQATVTFPSGQKYVGEFKDDKRNGQGTLTFPDGQKYVGEFNDGKRNGQGIEYAPSGSITSQGRWENGVLVQSFAIDAKFFPFTSPSVRAATSNQSSSKSAEGQMQTTASITTAKVKCADIGFTPGTEGFGKCVLQLSK
jgi:hypothetical protein